MITHRLNLPHLFDSWFSFLSSYPCIACEFHFKIPRIFRCLFPRIISFLLWQFFDVLFRCGGQCHWTLDSITKSFNRLPLLAFFFLNCSNFKVRYIKIVFFFLVSVRLLLFFYLFRYSFERSIESRIIKNNY